MIGDKNPPTAPPGGKILIVFAIFCEEALRNTLKGGGGWNPEKKLYVIRELSLS